MTLGFRGLLVLLIDRVVIHLRVAQVRIMLLQPDVSRLDDRLPVVYCHLLLVVLRHRYFFNLVNKLINVSIL